MRFNAIEFLIGMAIVWLSLRDVFDTVVVPGEARGPLSVARRLVTLAIPLHRRIHGPRVGISFAPLLLLAAASIWMLLLVIGFGLMTHAVRTDFEPPAQGFGEALYLAGTALTTVGFGNARTTGVASVLGVVGGLCGLGVVTLAVTYLLQVQANIASRDSGVLMFATSAGDLPSAVVLLERYAVLNAQEELGFLLRRARDWCAMVRQSHASHPSLIYFKSAGVGEGWPATLGAIIDLGLLIQQGVGAPELKGPATLALEEADGLAQELAALSRLEVTSVPTSLSEISAAIDRLRHAGYEVFPLEPHTYAIARSARLGGVMALAEHLGTRCASLENSV